MVGKREKKSKRKSFIGSSQLKSREKEEISLFLSFSPRSFSTNQLCQFFPRLSSDMSESGMAHAYETLTAREKRRFTGSVLTNIVEIGD